MYAKLLKVVCVFRNSYFDYSQVAVVPPILFTVANQVDYFLRRPLVYIYQKAYKTKSKRHKKVRNITRSDVMRRCRRDLVAPVWHCRSDYGSSSILTSIRTIMNTQYSLSSLMVNFKCPCWPNCSWWSFCRQATSFVLFKELCFHHSINVTVKKHH